MTQTTRQAQTKRKAPEGSNGPAPDEYGDLEHVDPENSFAAVSSHQASSDIESAILPFNEAEDLAQTQDMESPAPDAEDTVEIEAPTDHQADDSDPDDSNPRETLSFLDGVTASFTEPKFTASLNPDIENIDVTTPDIDSPKATLDELSAVEYTKNFTEHPENNSQNELARLQADIMAGLHVQRRAEKNLEAISKLLERAEINQNLLNRLEPENRRLKARNRALEEQVKQLSRKAGIDIAEAALKQTDLLDQHSLYDGLNTQLAELRKALRDAEKEAQIAKDAAHNNALSAKLAEKEFAAEQREAAHLRQKIKTLSSALEQKQADYIEAKKMADSLAQDSFDFRAQADSHAMKNRAVQAALETAERENKTLKNTLTGLYEDVQAYKVRSLKKLAQRDAEIKALQNPSSDRQKAG